MNIRTSALAMALLVSSAALPASAAVTVQGTRVIYDADKGVATVIASNRGDTPALVQVWLDDGDINASAGSQKLPFVLTPATRRLDAGSRQNYRLTYLPSAATALPADRESVLYFNLLDIPPKPENSAGQNLLQFAVRTRIKLFYRPSGLQGTQATAASALQWTSAHDNGVATLRVHNPSRFHVSFNDIILDTGATVHAKMLAPGQHQDIALPAGTPVPATFAFTWLDDYGVPHRQQVALGS